jgi:hypothetical protein
MVTKELVLVACALASLVVGCSPSTPPPAGTPVCDPGGPFFYSWSRNPLDDLSMHVQSALNAAGVTGANAYAEAYGEDELSQGTGAFCEFLPMETDFYVTLSVDTLTDPEVLGPSVEKVLTVLDRFPPEETPGPQPGYASITLVMGEEKSHLRFRVTTATEARGRGLEGARLLEALGFRP